MKNRKIKILLKIYLLIIFSIFILNSCKNKTENGNERITKTEWIIGKWKVTNSDFLPFEHISFCENLNINSIFEFKEDGILKVYNSKSESKNCNETQSYRIEKNKIVILEYDMFFEYEIISKSKNKLTLRIAHFPNSMYEKNKLSEKYFENIIKNGFKIYLIKEN
jgi:hypothetical protein